MKAILSVIGKDNNGIIGKVGTFIDEVGGNIEDISQTLMQGYFVMIMLVDLKKANLNFAELQQKLDTMGEELHLSMKIQREEIFNAMHRV
ncbi:MAG: ACT domain-containing protein [Clostridia bacterium]|nr:ACT domain-containing protein [Clostridia bacterium]